MHLYLCLSYITQYRRVKVKPMYSFLPNESERSAAKSYPEWNHKRSDPYGHRIKTLPYRV